MGLLDDAIREHLELKRRHGADPGEIAHQERAALEPVFPDEAGDGDGPALAEHEPLGEEPLAVPTGEPDAGEGFAEAAADDAGGDAAQQAGEDLGAEQPPGGADDALADFSHTGQETAELDMSAVLDEDMQGTSPPGEIVAAPPRQRSEPAAGPVGEDGFEWQSPGADGEQAPGDVPGQERLSFE
jgi:hypothetical protein